MSYFPCDIPFMSDEELKENGICIPKKRITNREKLAKMSNWELANWLCTHMTCHECPICPPNGAFCSNNLATDWLEAEAEDDNG